MKLKELNDVFLKEDSYADLIALLRQDPTEDDHGIFKHTDEKHTRKPYLTLRHINKLKRMRQAKREEQEKRKSLVKLMYAAPNPEA
jgi:hypothetical protein